MNNGTCNDSLLRKTLSHPLNKTAQTPGSSSKSVAAKTKSDTVFGQSKQSGERCKSVPHTMTPDPHAEPAARGQEVKTSGESGKASCPNSPLEGNMDFPSNDGSSSPKPKKTIFDGFRNTLGRKSKGDATSPLSQGESPVFAADGPESGTESRISSDIVDNPRAVNSTSASSPLAAATDGNSPSASTARVSGCDMVS